MTEKKYFEIKNDLYQKEIIKTLRKEISQLIRENENLKEEILDLKLIIQSLEAKNELKRYRKEE